MDLLLWIAVCVIAGALAATVKQLRALQDWQKNVMAAIKLEAFGSDG